MDTNVFLANRILSFIVLYLYRWWTNYGKPILTVPNGKRGASENEVKFEKRDFSCFRFPMSRQNCRGPVTNVDWRSAKPGPISGTRAYLSTVIDRASLDPGLARRTRHRCRGRRIPPLWLRHSADRHLLRRIRNPTRRRAIAGNTPNTCSETRCCRCLPGEQ